MAVEAKQHVRVERIEPTGACKVATIGMNRAQVYKGLRGKHSTRNEGENYRKLEEDRRD